MARRVILGQRGAGEFGIWVSRPGQDATTDPRPLLATNAVALQVLLAGEITPTTSNTATGVSYGVTYSFVPVVSFFGYVNTDWGKTYDYTSKSGFFPFEDVTAGTVREPFVYIEAFNSFVNVYARSFGGQVATVVYQVTKTPRSI